jgi:hypothetical protein
MKILLRHTLCKNPRSATGLDPSLVAASDKARHDNGTAPRNEVAKERGKEVPDSSP